MIVKKFTGATETEAVLAAKEELGSNAVVLNVKTLKQRGIFRFFRKDKVEITAALEEKEFVKDEIHKPDGLVKNDGGRAGDEKLQTAIEEKLDSLHVLLKNQMEKEKNTARNLEKTLNDDAAVQQSEADEHKDSSNFKFLQLIYNKLIDNEVDEKYANQLIEEADRNKKPNIPFDYILASIYQKMVLKFGKSEGITPADKGPKIVYFIGPTGVGKTTTIAKVASSFSVEEKKKVALITTDTYRIAAAEQLHTYANILEVPFLVAYTEEELTEAVANFREYDYIFVDTAGHSHQNEDRMELLGKFLDATKESAEQQVFLVLSATTKYSDLKRIAEQYRKVTDFQLIFTKLDETTALGSLYNLKMYTETPIAYVTCGQNVPEDIARFNPQKTVKQLLGGRH